MQKCEGHEIVIGKLMLEDHSNRLLTVVPVLISKRKAIRHPTGLSACRTLRRLRTLGPDLGYNAYDSILRSEMPAETALDEFADYFLALITVRNIELAQQKFNQ
ncbi:hypothetical protein J6590_094296 [Homalodisca vitripennis]|nr:hypothetical protein J6590_094296 [Homalodisca vitripennis]